MPTNGSAPVELVIFDCDGVLVDSERLAVRVESRLITELGWPLTEADILERFVGRTDAYMQGEIEASLGHTVPDWDELYRTRLHAAFHAELTAVEGIAAALDALAGARPVPARSPADGSRSRAMSGGRGQSVRGRRGPSRRNGIARIRRRFDAGRLARGGRDHRVRRHDEVARTGD